MNTRRYRDPNSLFIILPLIWGTILGLWTTPGSASPIENSRDVKLSRPPLRFEINEGQTHPQVQFTARDRDGIAFLTPGETVLQISRRMDRPDSGPEWERRPVHRWGRPLNPFIFV